MPKLFQVKFAWLVALVIAFLCPTSLDISWDGFPVNHRGEFILLLLAVLFFLRQYLLRLAAFGMKEAPQETKFSVVKRFCIRAVFVASIFLLILKIVTPPDQGIELQIRNPKRDTTYRHTSERFINKIEFGGPQIPWRLGFLNTLDYSFFSCPAADEQCLLAKAWKNNQSLSFEAKFKIPKQWLRDPDFLKLEFAGDIQVLSETNPIETGHYHSSPKQISIPLRQKGDFVELRYRNFECSTESVSSCLTKKSDTLSFSSAFLRLETVTPTRQLIIQRVAQFFISLTFLFLLCAVVCELCDSFLLLNFFAIVRTDTFIRWLQLSFASAFVLLVLFFITFKKPLLYKNWEFLSVELAGLIFCVSFALFKQMFSHFSKIENRLQSRVSVDLLLTVPGLVYLLFIILKLPSHDGFYLLGSGDDWLSYASTAYEFMESPKWFTHPHFVFTKPLFIYFRAGLYFLLGEGTTYIEVLLRYCLALTPLLFLPAISELLCRVAKWRWVIAVPVLAYAFFWALKNFASYVLIFWVNMGEIPEWFFGLLACVALFNMANGILHYKNYTFSMYAAATFSLLSCVSRLQSLAVLILPWVAVASIAKSETKRIVRTCLYCGVATLSIIILHALPVLLTDFNNLMAYFGWTTQVKGSEPLVEVLRLFWKKVTFAPQVKVLLISLPIIGTLALFFRRKIGSLSPFLFLSAFGSSLLLHAFIRDTAYPPRHFVFLSQSSAYLTILFSLILLAQESPSTTLKR